MSRSSLKLGILIRICKENQCAVIPSTDIPLSKNVSQYDTFYERIAKWRIPKLSHSLSRFRMSRSRICRLHGDATIASIQAHDWHLYEPLAERGFFPATTAVTRASVSMASSEDTPFATSRGKEGLFWPNLTKVRPLFTLSHWGSDNSPLLTWTLNELCILRHGFD